MTRNLPVETDPRYIAIEERSPRNRILMLTLAVFGGMWGLHRFYAGKVFTGILMFLTGGGFFIWWIIDVLMVLSGRFKDAEGRVLGPPMHVQRQPAGRLTHEQDQRHLPPQDRSFSTHEPDTTGVQFDDFDDPLLEDPLEEEFRKLAQQQQGTDGHTEAGGW